MGKRNESVDIFSNFLNGLEVVATIENPEFKMLGGKAVQGMWARIAEMDEKEEDTIIINE